MTMESLCFPVSKDGPELEVVIGINDRQLAQLVSAGTPIPKPLRLRGLIDCATDVTAAVPKVFQQLGIAHLASTSTQTASGQVIVRAFRVSLSIFGPQGSAGPALVRPNLVVTELATALQKFDVLIGLDILSECLFILDGPGKQFTLAF